MTDVVYPKKIAAIQAWMEDKNLIETKSEGKLNELLDRCEEMRRLWQGDLQRAEDGG